MVFSEKDVIELTGGKKYIVVSSLKENNSYYYYICEVKDDELEVNPVFKVITTVKENGNLFIKTIKDELLIELETKFKNKLNIE